MIVGTAVLWRWVVVAVISMAAIFWAYKIITENKIIPPTLPVYGEKNAVGADHTIRPFNLMNQDGKLFTQDDLNNRIYVADFFFASCEGICPRMSDQMERIAEKFKNDSYVKLLSHTVKPDEDSISVLKKYASDHHADSTQWNFVTGNRNEINDLARHYYLLGQDTDTTDSDYFVHTQYFALIDMRKRIRGFYDGTDSVEVNKLISDIDILLKENQ